jgi:hypothetical protein
LKLRNLNASCASQLCKSSTIESFFCSEKGNAAAVTASESQGGAEMAERKRRGTVNYQ